jgi:hypothetical protein
MGEGRDRGLATLWQETAAEFGEAFGVAEAIAKAGTRK